VATTLATLRDRVEATLQDATNATWSTDDIDEGIRQALQRYSLVNPRETITTLTLAADGREVDISSLTGYLHIDRVWWPYDSTNPVYPPNWRDFEVWPGDILFIKDPTEPTTGDKVRVWYTRPQLLNGLDSETSTTLPPEDDTLIVTGAAGIAAMLRSVEISEVMTIDGWSPQRLREWGQMRLDQFNAGLALLARRLASRASGIAEGPALDRWDDAGDW
jgi:hypothetical protein